MSKRLAFKLSGRDTLRLVRLYKEQDCLWNIFSANYKDGDLRQCALQQICDAMSLDGMTADDLKYKIKTLRSTYYLELDKIERAFERGVPYTTKMGWFEEMHAFLKNVVVKRKPHHTLSGQLDVEEETQSLTINRIQETMIKLDVDDTGEDPLPEPEYLPEFSHIQTPRMEPQPKRKKLNKMAAKEGNQETWLPWENGDDQKHGMGLNDDEYDIFGKHVACQLRQLSSMQFILAQEAIQSIITKCRITDLKKDTQ